MINLLRSIVDTLIAIVSFVIHTFTSLFHFLSQIPTYSTFLVNSINVLPNLLLPYALAGIFVSVVLFVLNRKGGY